MHFNKKDKGVIIDEYTYLKEKLSKYDYGELKGIGQAWSIEASDLDDNLVSLDADDYRDNYLNEYLGKLDAQINNIEINSLDCLIKRMFRTYVIFKFYPDNFEFLDYYHELHDWYMVFYKADVRRDMLSDNPGLASQIPFKVIRGN